MVLTSDYMKLFDVTFQKRWSYFICLPCAVETLYVKSDVVNLNGAAWITGKCKGKKDMDLCSL